MTSQTLFGLYLLSLPLAACQLSFFQLPCQLLDCHFLRFGFDAIQVAEAFHPESVLPDIGLLKMSGYDVSRHIRQQLVFVALTGWGQDEDRRRSQEGEINVE